MTHSNDISRSAIHDAQTHPKPARAADPSAAGNDTASCSSMPDSSTAPRTLNNDTLPVLRETANDDAEQNGKLVTATEQSIVPVGTDIVQDALVEQTADDHIRRVTAEINGLHGAVLDHLLRAHDRAERIGLLLIELKDRLPRGQFHPWIREHCGFSLRTAQRYMHWHSTGGPIASVGEMAAMSVAMPVPFNQSAGIVSGERDNLSPLQPLDGRPPLTDPESFALRFLMLKHEHNALYFRPDDLNPPAAATAWAPRAFCTPYETDAAWVPKTGAVVHYDSNFGHTVVWRRANMEGTDLVMFIRGFCDKDGGMTTFACRDRGFNARRLAWRLGHGDHPTLVNLETLNWKPYDLDHAECEYADLGIHPEDAWKYAPDRPFQIANQERLQP